MGMEISEVELITMRFDAVTTLMNSQFKGVNERLDKINGRVGKTEDEITEILVAKAISKEKQDMGLKELDELYIRVDEIDNNERNHISVCPVLPKLGELNKRVRVLEDTSLATITKKNLIISTITIIGMLIGIMIGSIQVNESLRAKQTQQIMLQSDSTLFRQIQIYEATKGIKNAANEKTVSPPLKEK